MVCGGDTTPFLYKNISLLEHIYGFTRKNNEIIDQNI